MLPKFDLEQEDSSGHTQFNHRGRFVDQESGNPASQNLRVGPLTNIPRVLEALRCDPELVFATTHFKVEDFSDQEHRIDFAEGAKLLSECVKATACEHFGVLLGQWSLVSHLGVAGQLSETAPTVATALNDMQRNLDLHDQGAVITVRIEGSRASVGYAIHLPDLKAVAAIYDLAAANICGLMRSLCGLNWNPSEVHLSRMQPTNLRPYRDCFRAPIRFDTAETAVIFPSEWLVRPPQKADQLYHRQIAAKARELHASMPESLSTRVRDLLRREVISNRCTAGSIAQSLNLHERSLNRRLRAEDTSFRELMNETRSAVSQHYLAGTGLAIADIATALGYGSTDAFDHAFRRWYGVSPSKWRQSSAKSSQSKSPGH
jgi:AraC-like DNA-binding protein